MRYNRSGIRAFTLVEILIALAVVGVLFGLIFAFYRSAIDRSKYVGAVATVDSISKAEEISQMNTGEYVAAADTQEVNEKLGLDIESKEYNFKVIGVTNDNFIVLAEKILDDINSGDLSSDQAVIARDKTGPIPPESVDTQGDETSPGENSPPGGDSPGGGSPGGGAPSGESSPVSTPGGGGSPTGGGIRTIRPRQSTLSADILNLLDGTISGQWALDLIANNSIKVVYVDINDYGLSGALAFWGGTRDGYIVVDRHNVFVTGNTIFVNENLPALGYPDTAIASIITHEATHADYDYHPQAWIDATKLAHPELTDSDIHITKYPGDSIDQEYQAFNNATTTWREIRGADRNTEMDDWITLQDTPPPPIDIGPEAAMKAEIRTRYPTNPPIPIGSGGLPEY
ncbi:MAG: prepilin-type N-terminal cleavage/methylation domain-containing protein [Candidatus Omnitrophica bacterium]|nr:prepilin-type N-terminal cleavage/methylation domain-containing protein [Candidatus Omnitrophota bacterium]MDD5310128.1 prepilin-type N-terminal cleavage/methylation domain-containing protein [Candidatus Omnitrophota bacterium]MDD5546295.1 prepilin-type N-terminal cleavage/methylation domain-containing protein [Candidatus Omnitrophota bacterium]